jgi:hypothetical protein
MKVIVLTFKFYFIKFSYQRQPNILGKKRSKIYILNFIEIVIRELSLNDDEIHLDDYIRANLSTNDYL